MLVIETYTYFFLAYLIFFTRRFFQIHAFVWIFLVISVVLISSIASLNPIERAKISYATQQPYVFSSTEKFLRILQKTGNHTFAKNIYTAFVQQTKSDVNQQHKDELEKLAYARLYLEHRQLFWETIYELQPSSREALFALTTLALQLRHPTTLQQYFEKLQQAEPNDKRILDLQSVMK